jgi:hypothetical protein
MPLGPLDEFLAHQTCETFDRVFTSDRNFYDRYYFNLHPSSDELFLVAGMGQYPNLGTMDAFVSVSHEGAIHVVRASRELGSDRMSSRVGPLGVEILEPMRKVRLRCEPNEWGLAFDLTFDATVPAVEEPRTFQRFPHGRVQMDTSRYSQVGTWRGTLEVPGRRYDVGPDRWQGARDHSWGIRGVGEPEPPGIRVKSVAEGFGFFHVWIPLQLEDALLKLFVEEDQHGNRLVEEAVRIPTLAAGGAPEPMGSPRFHYTYRKGSREIERVRIELEDPAGKPLAIEATPLRTLYLAAGSGYIPQPDWAHGMYQGELKVEGLRYDVSTPEARARYGPLYETLSRFELSTGEVGYGLLENLCVGTYHPHGFGHPGATG